MKSSLIMDSVSVRICWPSIDFGEVYVYGYVNVDIEVEEITEDCNY